MRSEWNTYTLDDIMKIIGGGTPKRAIPEYWEGDISWLSVVDFNTGNKYVSETKEHITEMGLQKSSTKMLEKGQIIISARGTVGALAQLSKPMAFNQSCYGLNAKPEYTTNDFLYYLVKQQVSNLQQITHGAVFDTITKDTFKQIDVDLPPLATQKKIAHILSTLDDKIDLNHKMNQTLEAMAQVLFKSWFVDFDPVHAKAGCSSDKKLEAAAKELGISKEVLELFPDACVESELGMIPEGWDYRKITEVCSTIGSGGTPKRMQDDNFNGGINWFTTKELKNSFVLSSMETITDKGLNTSSAKLFPINTVVMAIYAAPTVGRLGILTHESTFNQAACGFVADEDNISYEFLFLYLQDKNGYLNNLANGAAQQNLNVGLVKKLDVPIPYKSIMVAFKAIAGNIFSQMKNNIYQLDSLQKTRDTLLPKLLSGELDVLNIEFE